MFHRFSHTLHPRGNGLGSVLPACKWADIVDTNLVFFRGPAAPAIETRLYFCQKLGIELECKHEALWQK